CIAAVVTPCAKADTPQQSRAIASASALEMLRLMCSPSFEKGWCEETSNSTPAVSQSYDKKAAGECPAALWIQSVVAIVTVWRQPPSACGYRRPGAGATLVPLWTAGALRVRFL